MTDAERRDPAVSPAAWTLVVLALALVLVALVVFTGARIPTPAPPAADATPTSTPSPTSTATVKRTVTEAEDPESRSTTTTEESSIATTETSAGSRTTTTTTEAITEVLTTPSPAPPNPTQTPTPAPAQTPTQAPAQTPTPTSSTGTSLSTTTVTETTPTPTPGPATAVAGKNWDEYWSSTIAPLTGSVGFIAGAALALFVLARLLLELPFVRERRSSARDRRVLGITAVALLVGAPVALWWTGVQTQAKTLQSDTWLPFLLVALGLVGSVATAMWLASRMRLQVTVENAGISDAVDKLSREDVVSALKALAAPSKAIEVPTSMELATLADSLGSLSKSPTVSAIQGVVLFVIGIVPWQITVTQHTTTEASVLISRHGRMRHSERVALTRKPYAALELLAPAPAADDAPTAGETEGETQTAPATKTDADPKPAPPSEPSARDLLAVVAAAVVLMQLRKIETHDFDSALMGATSADSVALRYIAARWFTAQLQDPNGKKVLDAAITADPFHRLARWTRDWAEHRDAIWPPEIRDYADRLRSRLLERKAELGSIRAAAEDPAYTTSLMTLAAMARNLSALTSARRSDADRERVSFALERLREWAGAVSPTEDNRRARFRAQIDLLALDAALRGAARTPVQTVRYVGDPAIEASAALSYSLGCHLVRWCDAMFADDDVARLLARGVDDPAQRAFATKDPELTSARDTRGYSAFTAGLNADPSVGSSARARRPGNRPRGHRVRVAGGRPPHG